jgi:Calcineurin-like phosphoesterase
MKLQKIKSLTLNLLWMVLLSLNPAFGQQPFRLFLVGDAGDHKVPGETLVNLQQELNKYPNSAVVFLGDNSYKDIFWGWVHHGFKGFDSSENTMAKIRSQISLLDDYRGSAFFIPGNHDWWNRTTYEKGYRKLAMEESFIEENLKKNTSIANPGNVFLPKNGAYGPEYVELNQSKIRIIFIDTYRIVQTGIKKSKIPEEEKQFYPKLDSVIREGWLRNQKIIVVAHHPVYSYGPHTRQLKHPYLFRRIKASSPEFPSYHQMILHITKILSHYPGIYYAAGHLHALQYFYTRDSIHYIISGAGSKEIELSQKEVAKYAARSPKEFLLWNTGGFFAIDFSGKSDQIILYYDDGTRQRVMQE